MGGDAGLDAPDEGQTFYGSSSAHDFTRQMYGSVLQNDVASPTSGPTEATSSTQPVANSRSPYVSTENFSLLPRDLADRLMHLYWERVHVLYPFLHKPSFSQAYEDLWRPVSEHHPQNRAGLGLGASRDSGPSSVIFHCALNAVLALGVQFSDLPLNEKERLSASCLSKSKDLLRLDLFDNGDIALVQTLLLLTQYFQSTNWPNKCWTTIGLACRLAQGLGLHVEEDRVDQQIDVAVREIRRRAWHGCVTLDIIVSMTLGRPAMLIGSTTRSIPAPIDGDSELVLQDSNEGPISSIEFFGETVKLYRIIGRILLSIYKINDGHSERVAAAADETKTREGIVIGFDEDLTRFEADLPKGLYWKSSDLQSRETTGILARQSHVLHVRFLHARILLHRPGFLQFCRVHKESGDANRLVDGGLAHTALDSSLTCARTAVELITSVSQYSATEATGAWWYNVFYTRTAAMVVLLSGVCPPIREHIGDDAWEEAWRRCVAILTKNLPQYAPVRSCLTTLTALRDNVLRERNESASRGDAPKQVAGTQVPAARRPSSSSPRNPRRSEVAASSMHNERLLDATFDPFEFVESDLFFADFGIDFEEPFM
ncbi:hypothetical protein E8E13_009010 [Curvularia kusanoi]|uniref:Xylanolytic transcriptional activator regulatory domain-containing protein n=1 Tax=Curvularia kusanoi TaxID=90978 RepID=A0A9P4TME0_CURKU|nr:hypothetical protein E8E13_009010 [Curvularia kusanoi]